MTALPGGACHQRPGGGGVVDGQGHPHEPARGRRPGLPARHRPHPGAVVDLLRDRCCRSWRSARSCSSTARSRRPRSTSASSCSAEPLTAFWLNVVWMMAAQFYWEKDQGNLELYFTAPMHLMSILAGMAIGGLVMTSSRALAVIGIGSLLYGVTYDIQQPLPPGRRLPADDDPAVRHGDALRVASSSSGAARRTTWPSSSRSRSTSSAA